MKKKRYFLSVIEEGIQNPKYQMFRGGRIEVYDSKSKSGYAVYEARWLVPLEVADAFRALWDFKEFDYLPYIRFDMKECSVTK